MPAQGEGPWEGVIVAVALVGVGLLWFLLWVLFGLVLPTII